MFRDQGIRHVAALAPFLLLFLFIQGKKEELKTGGYIMAGSNEGLSNRLRCETFCFLLGQKNVLDSKHDGSPTNSGINERSNRKLHRHFLIRYLIFLIMCRVLAAYLHVSREVFHADLLFIWDVNVACPGHFLEIFQPIKGVSFISNSSFQAMEPYARAVFPTTSCRFEIIMKDHGFERNSLRGHETQLYRNFLPTREILRTVDNFLFDKDVRNFSSMHLRQTDMHTVLSLKQRATDASYDRFIDTRPENEKIYLLADNPHGQKRFLDKYGDRIIVYKKIMIPSSFVSHSHNTDCWNFDKNIAKKNKNITLPNAYRYTSLQHTLIDIIISAKSIVFKGSPFSSLSDLVVRFRSVLKEAEKMQILSNKSKNKHSNNTVEQ